MMAQALALIDQLMQKHDVETVVRIFSDMTGYGRAIIRATLHALGY